MAGVGVTFIVCDDVLKTPPNHSPSSRITRTAITAIAMIQPLELRSSIKSSCTCTSLAIVVTSLHRSGVPDRHAGWHLRVAITLYPGWRAQQTSASAPATGLLGFLGRGVRCRPMAGIQVPMEQHTARESPQSESPMFRLTLLVLAVVVVLVVWVIRGRS